MTYIMPGNTTTTMTQLFVWANNTTDGLVGYGILLMVLSMVFFGSKRYGAKTSHALMISLLTTSFVCASLSIMGIVNDLTLSLVLLSTALAYIFSWHD